MINIHCVAHRLALVTSQAAGDIDCLKDLQHLLTDLFYYFSKSSNRSQDLEEIQDILKDPRLKIKEIHEVRWLSFFEALSTVYSSLPALLTFFDGVKKQKDAKGEGLARRLATQKTIYVLTTMLDVMAPVMVMVQAFQTKDLDPAMVGVHLETCISGLDHLLEPGSGPYMKQLD